MDRGSHLQKPGWVDAARDLRSPTRGASMLQAQRRLSSCRASERARQPALFGAAAAVVVCVYGRVSERPVRSSKACARGDLLCILLFSCSSCPPTSVGGVCPSFPSLPPSGSVLLPAAAAAAWLPLSVCEKESGGHETGGGAADARLRG